MFSYGGAGAEGAGEDAAVDVVDVDVAVVEAVLGCGALLAASGLASALTSSSSPFFTGWGATLEAGDGDLDDLCLMMSRQGATLSLVAVVGRYMMAVVGGWIKPQLWM